MSASGAGAVRAEDARWRARCAALEADLARFESLAVAFSGGVDSSVLLAAAHEVLGTAVTAVIADSPSISRRELASARRTAAGLGVRLVVLATDELSDPDYRANAGARCYHCKRTLFEAMLAWAGAAGVRHLAFGEIADDLLDERPGRRAAREAEVHAPLARAGFTKDDVRRFARARGLEVAEKPASACLASRLPPGTPVSRARLARVEAAEDQLHDLGLAVVRVRDLGARARLEVGRDELARATELRPRVAEALARAGFEREFELEVYLTPQERVRGARSSRVPNTESHT